MVSMRRRDTLAAGVLLLLAAGCRDEPAGTPTTPPVLVESPTNRSSASDQGADAEDPTEFPSEPTGTAAQEAAAQHAEATLEALWNTDAGQAAWHKRLSALITPELAESFSYTQVENIRSGKIAGPSEVTFLDNGSTAEVTVPSDQGAWTLTLHRLPAGSPGDWTTSAIAFPEED